MRRGRDAGLLRRLRRGPGRCLVSVVCCLEPLAPRTREQLISTAAGPATGRVYARNVHGIDIDGLTARLPETTGLDTPTVAQRTAVHTFYGGAQLFKAGTPLKLGKIAMGYFERYAATPTDLAEIHGWTLDAETLERVHDGVAAKLRTAAIEEYRIDFEDGFGAQDDATEDAEAVRTAREVAILATSGDRVPGLGIRIRSLDRTTAERALRTLALFFNALAAEGEKPPRGFTVVLPKVYRPVQVEVLADALGGLESRFGFDRIGIELLAEDPRIFTGDPGEWGLAPFLRAGDRRITSVHFGAYDYLSLHGVMARHQTLDHDAADLARGLVQLSLAGTGVELSDGATNVMPIPPHRHPAGAAERAENLRVVKSAWREHAGNIERALRAGIFRGWDLHPGQLPARHATVQAFFVKVADEAGPRLRRFLDNDGNATITSGTFDDAATVSGLLQLFVRASESGALDVREIQELTGLTAVELDLGTLGAILSSRRNTESQK